MECFYSETEKKNFFETFLVTTRHIV